MRPLCQRGRGDCDETEAQFGMGLGGDSFQRRRGEGGRNELGVQHFLFSAAEMIFVMLMRNFSGRCAILAERNQ